MDIATEFAKYFSLDNFLFVLFGLMGMLGHAIKRYLNGQLKGSLKEYLFINNPKRSAMAAMTCVGATVALILGDQLPTQAGAFVMLAFTTGYTADSSVNNEDSAG